MPANTTWLARRALTDNSKTPPATLRQTGLALLEAGQEAEAADFFKAAGDRDALCALADRAAAAGDFFLYQQVANTVGPGQAGADRLRALIDAADRAGLARYAEKARGYLAEHF